MNSAFTQQIIDHQWKNRLVILVTDSLNNVDYKNQIRDFKQKPEFLKERKIKIISVEKSKNRYTQMDTFEWKSITKEFNKYTEDTHPFVLYLIGLDGGIKYISHQRIDPQLIFDKIDAMPMRQRELQYKSIDD